MMNRIISCRLTCEALTFYSVLHSNFNSKKKGYREIISLCCLVAAFVEQTTIEEAVLIFVTDTHIHVKMRYRFINCTAGDDTRGSVLTFLLHFCKMLRLCCVLVWCDVTWKYLEIAFSTITSWAVPLTTFLFHLWSALNGILWLNYAFVKT